MAKLKFFKPPLIPPYKGGLKRFLLSKLVNLNSPWEGETGNAVPRGVKMKKILCILILLSCFYLNSKTWIREYTYQASEADSKITSRAIALEQVKRLLLQEIGMYMHSTVLSGEIEASGKVKDLTAKQIEIISAGITETKIIEENWNGVTYYMKAEITADENDVVNRLDTIIEDNEKSMQLEKSHRRTEKALAEIDSLKIKLAKTRNENQKLKLQKKYNQSSNELSAEDWFQKGVIEVHNGYYEKGIEYFNKSAELHARPETLYNIGLAYGKLGNYNKEIEYYIKTNNVFPIFNSYYNLGVAYFDIGKYDDAIECYKNAIEFAPNNPDVYFNLGNVYLEIHKEMNAIINFKKTIELNPYDEVAYYNMGNAYSNLGNYDDAIINYENAIELNPYYVEAYNNMGFSYVQKGNFEKSIKYAQIAARLGYKPAQELLLKFGIQW
ncbi:MAG: tetratricopeptide repeat protein [Candidatus Cloacimonetes bacterium]|nr:tetratricopeptide repeat protein [Candidatus Cloacimonadota bacterium]MCF7814813.1 tetratricopeptide repeat protein [Candidatus Cloacimonadota bacterium]MCF7867657.1 tetratricopeptide repeat protein [Candidatus Cloacimonadota bacterium]MCF7883545.1 tetratricopeptide repeat protein [Candidatus Cloacimonadota bacterium]